MRSLRNLAPTLGFITLTLGFFGGACGPGELSVEVEVERIETPAGTFQVRPANVELLRRALAGEPTEHVVIASSL